MEPWREQGKHATLAKVTTMRVPIRLILLSAAAMAVSAPAASVAQTTVRSGPRGGAVASGPNGAVARGPNGGAAAVGRNGAAVRGPGGAAAAVGPNGGAATRDRYGNAAVRGPNGGVAVGRPGYGASTGRAYYYGGRRYYGVYAPRYAYPPGWAYRRWAVGAVLPALFLTSAYYYSGYAAMGLPPPASGHQWVRYGPDLLLVDTRTGNVIHTAYGVFEEG
jgi:Ni/Co efflux regulator RcnB